MGAHDSVVAPEAIAGRAFAERRAGQVLEPGAPILVGERRLEPFGKRPPVGPRPVVGRQEIESCALAAARCGELRLDLGVHARAGLVCGRAILGAQRSLHAAERKGVGDVVGDAAHVVVGFAAFDEVGSEGHFVVHVLQYVMRSAGPQDRRDD